MSKFTRWLEALHARQIAGTVSAWAPEMPADPPSEPLDATKGETGPELRPCNSVALETACEVLHDAYEKAAIGEGWKTQIASRKPWTDVPEANKATMRAAVGALLHWVEASECAHTALSLIYRKERDEALGRLERRGMLLSAKQAMLIDAESEIATLTATIKRLEELSLAQFHEWDRLRATIERRTNVAVRLEGIVANQERTIAYQQSRRHAIERHIARLAADLLAKDATIERLWDQLQEACPMQDVQAAFDRRSE